MIQHLTVTWGASSYDTALEGDLKEDMTNIPNMGEGSFSKGKIMSDIESTPDSVEKKLNALKPNKAQGPDQIPPSTERTK